MNKTKSQLVRELIRGNEITVEQAKSLGSIENADESLSFKYVIRGDNFLGKNKYSSPPHVATICGLLGNLVAKRKGSIKDYLYEEFKDHKKYYDLGADLTKPIEFCNVFNFKEGKFERAIISEFEEGKTIGEFRKTKYFLLAKKLHAKVLEKTEKLGINPYLDAGYRNTIYNQRRGRVKLIDPESWEMDKVMKGTEKEMEENRDGN